MILYVVALGHACCVLSPFTAFGAFPTPCRRPKTTLSHVLLSLFLVRWELVSSHVWWFSLAQPLLTATVLGRSFGWTESSVTKGFRVMRVTFLFLSLSVSLGSGPHRTPRMSLLVTVS